MRFLSAIALSCALQVCAVPATAQDSAAPAPAPTPACDAAHATPASFADATTSLPVGTCVAMEGVRVGFFFAEDGRARYAPQREENMPSSSGTMLGLYGPSRDLAPMRVRIVGRIDDCDNHMPRMETGADGGETLIMPTGFCHYFRGRAIMASETTDIGDAGLVRMTRAMAGPDAGNLSPIADGDVARQMAAAARRLLTAIRSGDRAALTAMHGGGEGGARDDAGVGESVALMLDSQTSPFAALRTAAPVSVAIFGWKPPLWADAEWHRDRARTGTAEGLACFSAAPDAAALWPIDSRDADNVDGRPYACSRILLLGTGADAPVTVETLGARQGFPEAAPPR